MRTQGMLYCGTHFVDGKACNVLLRPNRKDAIGIQVLVSVFHAPACDTKSRVTLDI